MTRPDTVQQAVQVESADQLSYIMGISFRNNKPTTDFKGIKCHTKYHCTAIPYISIIISVRWLPNCGGGFALEANLVFGPTELEFLPADYRSIRMHHREPKGRGLALNLQRPLNF